MKGGEGRGGRRGRGRRETGEQLGKRKGGSEKKNFFCIREARAAQRKKRETRGLEGRRGRAPPRHHLSHPSIKKHKY